MGCFVSKPSKVQKNLPFVNQGDNIENAAVVLEENFKIVDYTGRLKGVKEIRDGHEVNEHFSGYRPSDIRCVKGKNENKTEHSHLLMIFSSGFDDDGVAEIGVITDYSRYGFAITIGDIKLLKQICNLKGAILELLHLPKAENQNNVNIGDVVEWAYLHKDEEYKNPKLTPELNMGKRIFRHLIEKLSDEYNSTRARA